MLFDFRDLLFSGVLLAGLVADRAGRFAGRLAGASAFPATRMSLFHRNGYRFDSVHDRPPLVFFLFIILKRGSKVKDFGGFFNLFSDSPR